MTGFGRGSSAQADVTVEAEFRTVNGKSLSVKLRVPSDRMEAESRVEARIRRGLERGTLSGSIRVRLLSSRQACLDLGSLQRHLSDWRQAQKNLGLSTQDPELSDLLSLPGVMEVPVETSKHSRPSRRPLRDGWPATRTLRGIRSR